MLVNAQTQYLTAAGLADGHITVQDATNIAPGASGLLSDNSQGPISVRVEAVDYQTNTLLLSENNVAPDLSSYTPASAAKIYFSKQSVPSDYVPINPAVGFTNPAYQDLNSTHLTKLETTGDQANGNFFTISNRTEDGRWVSSVETDYDTQRGHISFNLHQSDDAGQSPSGFNQRFNFRRYTGPNSTFPITDGFGFEISLEADRLQQGFPAQMSYLRSIWSNAAEGQADLIVGLAPAFTQWIFRGGPDAQNRVGNLSTPNATNGGTIAGSATICGIPDPIEPYDAANRHWVLNQLSGIPNIVLNAKDYGAIGDGVTDDSVALQAAIDGLTDGGILLIPPGRYRHVSELYLRNGVTIAGYGPASIMFFDPAPGGSVTDHAAFVWEGVYPDEPNKRPAWDEHPASIIAISPAVRGATTVTATVPGTFDSIAAGDWVMIVEGVAPKWNTKIQHVRVLSRSGDTLTLTRSLDFTFDGASGGSIGVIRITPIQNAWIKDLTIATGVNSSYEFLTGLAVGGGFDSVIFDPYVTTDPTFAIGEPFANDTHQFTINNCVFKAGNFGGFNRASYGRFTFNQLPNIRVSDGEYGEGASYCVYAYNFFGGKTGANPMFGIGGGYYLDFSHNQIVGATANVPIKVTAGEGHRIAHNTFTTCYGTAIGVGIDGGWSSGYVVDGIFIVDNHISLVPTATLGVDSAIQVWDYPNVKNAVITGNNTTHHIKIGNGGGASDKRTFAIYGNTGPGAEYTVHSQIPWGAYGGYLASTLSIDPTTYAMTFERGLYYEYTHDASLKPGFVVQSGGTTGTLNGGNTTGSIDINTKILTVNAATDLKPGQYITIGGVSGVKKVVAISGTTVTLDTNADATVVAAAVAFSAPVWTWLPKGGAAQGDSIANDVATLRSDFNALLANLRAGGAIKTA